MKTRKNVMLVLALVVLMMAVSVGVALAFEFPYTTTVGVLPEEVDPWTTGDAAQECVVNLGYDFGLKIDEWDSTVGGSYSCTDDDACAPGFENTITISNNDGIFFDWESSPFALGAVVVKGGPVANVFSYDPAAFLDTGLYSPINPNNGNPYAVSHASFCWNEGDVNGCYQDETAWAIGSDYNDKGGNWAMYVDFAACDAEDGVVDGICTTGIRADGGDGVGMDAGTATLTSDGTNVTVDIALANTFIFYYDLNDDEEDNNLKVQDYDTAPKGNPKVGKFDHKTFIPVGSTTGSITVPLNNFYGVHLDLAYQVPCS